ncbi:hypothetical protein V8C44DRAFT_352899 [Trichoderma aethiopicum]
MGWPMLGVCYLYFPRTGGKDSEILPLSSSTSCLTSAWAQTSTHESRSHLREWNLCSPVRRCDFTEPPFDEREAGGENRGNKVISSKGQGSAIPAEADELPEMPSAPPSRAGHMHTIRTKWLIGVGDDARRGPPR